MTAIDIRPVVSSDFETLLQISNGIGTSHTWQMNNVFDQSQIQVNFRRIRFPRVVDLDYSRSATLIADTWKRRDLFLVARIDSKQCAYLSLDLDESQSGRVIDLAVDENFRRQGVATSLLIAAQDWLKTNGIYRMTMAVSVKNEAVINLVEKLGFVFSGFMDGFFRNREIALFYSITFR